MYQGKLNFRSVSRVDRGKVRQNNEDSVIELADNGIWAVADGMGGHLAGDVASQMVVSGLQDIRPADDPAQLPGQVRQSIERVNMRLYMLGAGNSTQKTMGATVVAFLVRGDHYAVLWAGDSRLYVLRDGALHQLTRDHSHVQDLVDRGEIQKEEAETHPMRNVITRAVGAHETLQLDDSSDAVEPGDRYLLCTDGVSNVLRAQELEAFLGAASIDEAADKIVAECLERGAPDNLGLVIVEASAP